MNKGVSIIVSSYNRPDLLKQSIISLRDRTKYEPIEIVIIDDGSDSKYIEAIRNIKDDCNIDKVLFLPQKKKEEPRSPDIAWTEGLLNSNSLKYPYVYFTADDFIYRTGWLTVLIEMIESDWAEEHKVKMVSAFDHWIYPKRCSEMTTIVNKLYISKNGNVQGYAWNFASTYLLDKRWFNSIGKFENNLKKESLPEGRKNHFEFIIRAKIKEFNFICGITIESYVQHMAEKSTLNSFLAGAKDSELYKNQMAVGSGFKDI